MLLFVVVFFLCCCSHLFPCKCTDVAFNTAHALRFFIPSSTFVNDFACFEKNKQMNEANFLKSKSIKITPCKIYPSIVSFSLSVCQEHGAWKGKQIESERLKTHTSSTPSKFREVTHTNVETTDSRETVNPLRVTIVSAEEEALRREELTSPVSNSVIMSDQGPHTSVLSAPSLERTADSLVSRS